jgi:peptide/nickel transport system permease protein
LSGAAISRASRIAALMVAMGTLASLATWVPYAAGNTGNAALLSPAWPHFLGTDRLGRDVMQVTVSAAAYSVMWALIVMATVLVLGLFVALVSARWWRSWPDHAIAALAEALRSFPSLVLALLFFAAGVSVNLVLILYFWIPFWRGARSQLAAQRDRPYVLVGRLSGHSHIRTLALHALPNALHGFGGIVLLVFVEILSVQAGLEFLGFSAPLSRPTLGNVASEALRLGGGFAWVWLPATLIASTIAIALVLLARSDAVQTRRGLE